MKLLFCQGTQEMKTLPQGAREGNKKTQGEIHGSIEISAFPSFTLYFFPSFSTHPSFLIVP
jgi:hypothetical protein